MKEDPRFQYKILNSFTGTFSGLELEINKVCNEENYKCIQVIDSRTALLEKVVYVPREEPDLPF